MIDGGPNPRGDPATSVLTNRPSSIVQIRQGCSLDLPQLLASDLVWRYWGLFLREEERLMRHRDNKVAPTVAGMLLGFSSSQEHSGAVLALGPSG